MIHGCMGELPQLFYAWGDKWNPPSFPVQFLCAPATDLLPIFCLLYPSPDLSAYQGRNYLMTWRLWTSNCQRWWTLMADVTGTGFWFIGLADVLADVNLTNIIDHWIICTETSETLEDSRTAHSFPLSAIGFLSVPHPFYRTSTRKKTESTWIYQRDQRGMYFLWCHPKWRIWHLILIRMREDSFLASQNRTRFIWTSDSHPHGTVTRYHRSMGRRICAYRSQLMCGSHDLTES